MDEHFVQFHNATYGDFDGSDNVRGGNVNGSGVVMKSKLLAFLLGAVGAVSAWPVAAQDVGSIFIDCEICPTMVVVPAGTFRMGDLAGSGLVNERPVHEVRIPHAFAVSTTEITYAQWDACVADGGCTHVPADDNWGRGNRAVAYVSWDDAADYLAWLSGKSGKQHRLLTESEWEYVTRAGTETLYPWGDEVGAGKAVCLSCDVGSVMTIEVGKTPSNNFGLYDTVGSQKEWVQDCWNLSYDGAPADGSAWMSGQCDRRVVRGGSWYDSAKFIRSASRASGVSKERQDVIGFRIARDL